MTQGPIRPLRIALLAKGWTGYMDASFVRLAERGHELLLVSPRSMSDTAFAGHGITDHIDVHWWDGDEAPENLNQLLLDFAPDAVLTHSWEIAAYRDAMRALKDRTLRILWMDNVWRATPKQYLGRVISRWYLHGLFDAVMLPGERTEQFARKLGFKSGSIIRGSTSADTDLFAAAPAPGDELKQRRRFVAALRLVHHKGADVLAEAYASYRQSTEDPWDLAVVGIGPMSSSFEGLEGVTMQGFLQPKELAALMHESSAYINPSRIDPYAVVLHEAAAASLPILTTDLVGASLTMVQDGYNGWVLPPADPDALAAAMKRLSELPAARLEEMARMSHAFSQRLSPAGWARNIEEEVERRI